MPPLLPRHAVDVGGERRHNRPQLRRYHFPAEVTRTPTPGWYRIALAEPPDVNLAASGYPPFPHNLRRPDLAGIDREILAAGENTLDFLIEVGE